MQRLFCRRAASFSRKEHGIWADLELVQMSRVWRGFAPTDVASSYQHVALGRVWGVALEKQLRRLEPGDDRSRHIARDGRGAEARGLAPVSGGEGGARREQPGAVFATLAALGIEIEGLLANKGPVEGRGQQAPRVSRVSESLATYMFRKIKGVARGWV